MAKPRDKGTDGELELRDVFRKHGYQAERGGHAQGNGARKGLPDVNSNCPGIWPECKRVEAFSCMTRAMEQAKRDSAGSGLTPTVWSRSNRAEWLTTMRAEDWFAMKAELEMYRGLFAAEGAK